jgi:hypothetical protein
MTKLKTKVTTKKSNGIKPVVKSSFHKESFYYGTCSKCDAPFTTNDEIGQEVYPTKAELIEAMKDYDWQIKGDEALCDNCF